MSSIRNRTAIAFAALGFCLSLASGIALAQAATDFLGTVTAIDGNTLSVKTAKGEEHQVQVPATADLKRIEPGQTSLSAAVTMQFSDLAVGDHVLVRVGADAAAATPQALRVIAIKAADVAKKQQQEAAEWQKNGVGGLVKSVDPGAGIIVVNSGSGPAAKTVVIHVATSTVLKRYAPASVNYASAQPASFDAIHPGDQLMARGGKNPDGTELTAEEVVSGTFRNLSGLVQSLDPSQQTFTVKDLATKKQFTVKVPADAQMRQLPDRLAQMLAARLKGAAGAGRGSAPAENGAGGGPRAGAMDPQQMLSRAPAIHFGDLQKGEAVMLVATPGDGQVTAITLIAGVEALLEAPASQDLLANWSMGSGDAAAAGGDAGSQ